MGIRKQLTAWAAESLHIYAHTRHHAWDISRGTACWSLSLTLRTLIYDFSLAAPTHQCDSAPSCIIMNSSIKCTFDSWNEKPYLLHAPSTAAEGMYTISLKSRISCRSSCPKKRYFTKLFCKSSVYKFWKDSKTVVLCKYKDICYLIIVVGIYVIDFCF